MTSSRARRRREGGGREEGGRREGGRAPAWLSGARALEFTLCVRVSLRREEQQYNK